MKINKCFFNSLYCVINVVIKNIEATTLEAKKKTSLTVHQHEEFAEFYTSKIGDYLAPCISISKDS